MFRRSRDLARSQLPTSLSASASASPSLSASLSTLARQAEIFEMLINLTGDKILIFVVFC